MQMAKLYTPLENQESMFKKRHKNVREKKWRKVQNMSCTLVVSKIDSTTPKLLAGRTHSLVPPLPKT